MQEAVSQGSIQPQHLHINHLQLQSFSSSLLVSNGVPKPDADIISACLVLADLRGVDTHGTQRLPSYIARIRAGTLDPAADPVIKTVTPVVSHIDARNGFGFVSARLGMTWAIDAAKVYGIAMVSISHSNHFGMSAWLCEQATKADMMALVFTNSSPALPAWGGKEKVLGCSPIACGAPAGRTPPFILDFAPSVVARGKVHKALRRGERIPHGWALNAQGRPTDDPAEALKGLMQPMGGPKGAGLAVMMDVFSGVLSGSAFAGGVTGPFDQSKPANAGHFLMVIKPDLFMDLEKFKSRMDTLYQSVAGSEKAEGVDRIYFPGEIEQLTRLQRERTGIPFLASEFDALNAEAARAGITDLGGNPPPAQSIEGLKHESVPGLKYEN